MFRKIINKVLQLNIVSESTENDKYFLTIGMERQVRKTLMSDFKNDTRIIPFGKLTIYKANINFGNYLEIGDVASGFLSDGVTFIPFGQYKGGDINDVNSWNTIPLDFTPNIANVPYLLINFENEQNSPFKISFNGEEHLITTQTEIIYDVMPAYPNAWNNNLNFTEDHLIQTPTYTGTMRLYEWNETTLTYDYKYTADSHMAEYPSGVGLFDKKYKVVVCVKIFVPET